MASSTGLQPHALETESLSGNTTITNNSKETKEDPDKYIEFDLYPDVYVFLCLLYKNGHWSKMPASDKFVVFTFFVISFIVQFSSMALMLYISIGYEDDFNNGEMVYEIEYPSMSGPLSCIENGFGSNYTLNYTQCTFTEHNFVYAGEVTAKDFLARAISMGLVMCFVYSNIASLVHYTLMIQNAYGENSSFCARFQACGPWILVFGAQVFVITVLFVSISRLILFQTSLLNVLSIGIGFVILMEVDDHMYAFAKKITYTKRIDFNESEFFNVKIERENRNVIIQNGIFQYAKVQTFNCIIFWAFCVSSVWAIVSLMIRYHYYYPYDGRGVSWQWSLIDKSGYLFLIASALPLAWIPLKKCCKCK